MKEKQKIFITGVNGLLGQKLVAQLIEIDTFEIIGCGKGESRIPSSGFKYISLDITEEEKVKEVISQVITNASDT